MRILKTKWFARFARRARIADALLVDVVRRAEQGLIDADLGGGLFKQRVARPGQGRSGGHRILIGYRRGDLAVMLYGFAKNERDNIDDQELLSLQEITAAWLAMTPQMLASALAEKRAEEIYYDAEA